MRGEKKEICSHLAGLEPATFRLTAERANRLRHKCLPQSNQQLNSSLPITNRFSLSLDSQRLTVTWKFTMKEREREREREKKKRICSHLAGLEPATFRLTAERANQLRHKCLPQTNQQLNSSLAITNRFSWSLDSQRLTVTCKFTMKKRERERERERKKRFGRTWLGSNQQPFG